MIRPVVADMAHFNPVDFAKFAASGGVGVILKASQGVGVTDPTFVARRELAKAAGLLVGRYSFATGDDPVAHAKHFLSVGGKPYDDELCDLDFEDNPHSPMSGQQAYDFMREVEDHTGRKCWVYGGNRIFEQITPLCQRNSQAADYFKARPLWLCQYKTGLGAIELAALKPHIRVPAPWNDWTLLQYTGDGVGPLPHTAAGLENGADLNAFDGSDDALRAAWAGAALS
jgi:GH25 family lysozyme M1 (1,4-beta-N-acetylmuramidase)